MQNPIKNADLTFICPEKWENMTTVGNNKYCGKCKHLVVDFTKLTQEEFDEAIRNAPGRLCGKFTSTQTSSKFLKYAAASAMAASMLAPTSCATEDPAPVHEGAQDPSGQIMEETHFEVVGFVLIPDSTMNEADTTLLEEPFEEDQYFSTE